MKDITKIKKMTKTLEWLNTMDDEEVEDTRDIVCMNLMRSKRRPYQLNKYFKAFNCEMRYFDSQR